MIRTDGKPTIAMRESDRPRSELPPPITDGRDPGDEHHEPRELRAKWTVDGTDSGNGTAETEDA